MRCCDGVPDLWQPLCTELVAREVALMKAQLCVICPYPWAAHLEMPAPLGASLAARHINILVCAGLGTNIKRLLSKPTQQCCKFQSPALDMKITGQQQLEYQ